ncbi:hypothetical protein ACFXCZ_24340 [Streptomyces sp. NPDC059396]
MRAPRRERRSLSHARRSSEQLALRLERTSKGWRATALPWA